MDIHVILKEKQEELHQLQEQLVDLLCIREDTQLFTIECSPSNTNIRHIQYRGTFSTRKEALRNIPESGQSIEKINKITWIYTVVECDDPNLRKLNQQLVDFPYF